MSRSERWNTVDEIIRHFHDSAETETHSGPTVFYKGGCSYIDDSESHIAVIGKTGIGKSQCCSLHFWRNTLMKKESLIVLDPKGEGYKLNSRYITEDYQEYLIDLRNPRRSPTAFNLLAAPYRLYKSPSLEDNDIACSMISELWSAVYPCNDHSDPFWPQSAANYAKGLTYGLFDTASENQINLKSISMMMEKSNMRKMVKTNLEEYYNLLPEDSLARRNLATYVTAPSETRASIHSVAVSGLEVFTRSNGLLELLCDDTLHILDLDVDRPFILTIITPDETSVYDTAVGILISQVTQQLIRVAQEKGGRLPIRVNMILEELGSLAKCIPNLCNLIVAGRSRNIRLMMVLQSYTQLIDAFKKSGAETILSCIGTTIAFPTNNWETLNELSQRCGKRQVYYGNENSLCIEPLITPAQLAAMPAGTALIFAGNKYKFVSSLPFFHDLYDDVPEQGSTIYQLMERKEAQYADIELMVESMKKDQDQEIVTETGKSMIMPISLTTRKKESEPDMDALFAQIDALIDEEDEEDEDEEDEENGETGVTLEEGFKDTFDEIIIPSKEQSEHLYWLKITKITDDHDDAIRILRRFIPVRIGTLNKMLNNPEAIFHFRNVDEVVSCMEALSKIGVVSMIGFDFVPQQ